MIQMTSQIYSPRKVWLEIKPAVVSQKPALIVGFCSLLLLGLSQAMFLLLIKGFIKALFTHDGAGSIAVGELLPRGLISTFGGSLDAQISYAVLAVVVPVAIIIAGLVMSLALYFYQYSQQALSMYVAKFLRERVFSQILGMAYGRIAAKSPGDWMSVIMNDIMFLQNRLSDLLTALFKDSVVILSCYAVLLYIHLPTAIILALLSPFIALGMGRTGKRIARFAENFQRELANISAIVLNLRERFEFIRAQHGEARELSWFRTANSAYYLMIRKSILIRSAFAPAMELLGFVIFAGLVWGIGSGHWLDVTPELLMQFFIAIGLMLRPLREVGEQVSRLQETLGAMTSCLRLLSEGDFSGAEPQPSLPNSSQPLVNQSVKKFSLKSVEFGYGGSSVFSAKDLNFSVGKSIAVVGASGSGKSTLIKTLAGLLPPIVWQSEVDWSQISGCTSFVSQEPFLFDDSIRANLLYGITANIPTDQELLDTLEKVNLVEQIKNANGGLDAHFRALGANLSGGQIQRLVIARALLRGKSFLLLDEATSAVDAEAERGINKFLTETCQKNQIGLLVVTHRLEWLAMYDEIWFVDAGKIVARGTLADLMAVDSFRNFSLTGSEVKA